MLPLLFVVVALAPLLFVVVALASPWAVSFGSGGGGKEKKWR